MSVPNELGSALSVMTSLSVYDWISIVTSVVAVAGAIILTVMQIRQNNRTEALKRRLDDHDELLREMGAKVQAVTFISIGR